MGFNSVFKGLNLFHSLTNKGKGKFHPRKGHEGPELE